MRAVDCVLVFTVDRERERLRESWGEGIGV